MRLQIFDVEHGACSLLTADDNTRLMIDCGHNATTGWKPGNYLLGQGITALDMLAVTNYDEDHASGATDLLDKVYVAWLLRNASVSGATIRSLKRENGIGPGIQRIAYAIDHVFTGPLPGTPVMVEPAFQGCTRQVFYSRYPRFEDENNLGFALSLFSGYALWAQADEGKERKASLEISNATAMALSKGKDDPRVTTLRQTL